MIETVREGLLAFVEKGGPLVTVLFGISLVMWTLMGERALYIFTGHRKQVREVQQMWQARTDRTSWQAKHIRSLLLSTTALRLESTLPLLGALVAICPLIGLLGTVTGMIEVFDVVAVAGNGNPRAMAAGVSRATLPTMAGLATALPGVVAKIRLGRYAQNERLRVSDLLETH